MSTIVILINDIKDKLVYSIGITYLIFGTIGNLINIFLFKRRSLWKMSPCVPFMMAASIANMITIYTLVLTRVLIGLQITPTYNSAIACKLQIYFCYTSFSTSSWFMVGCCMDRFFCSARDALLRRYSSMQMTSRIIAITIIFFVVLYAEVFYCFDANRLRAAPCYTSGQVCSTLDTCLFFLCQYAGPPVLMLGFGFGTFIHMQQRRFHQEDSINSVSAHSTLETHVTRQSRKSNRIILPMLIGQVALYIIGSLPFLAMRIYGLVPVSSPKNNLRLTIENLILNMSIYISLIDKIFAFYIFTLTSKHFRRELIKLLIGYHSQRRIHP